MQCRVPACSARGSRPRRCRHYMRPFVARALSDVSLIDLRSGKKRFLLTHAGIVRAARFGQFGDTHVLLTTTQQAVSCWDLDRREKLYEFNDAVNIDALAVDGVYAGMAAGAIRLWRFAQNPSVSGAETIRFGDAAWHPRRLAVRVAGNAILAVAATQSTANNSYRLEIWDVSQPLATSNLRLSWPVNGEIRDVVIVDETTIAISRRESGQTGVVEILSVSARDQVPVVRWRRQLNADAAVKLTILVPPGSTPGGTRLVFDDGTSLGAWALAPRLQIANDRAVNLHLPVQVLDTLSGVGTISADVVTGGKAFIYLATDTAPADLLRLHPESAYRETFGFVARLIAAGAAAGNRAVCLWRNIQGRISGSLVNETTTPHAATLAAAADPSHPIILTTADFVQLQFTAFNPDAAVKTRTITTISARLAVTLPQGQLSLDIGEQRPEGDDAHPSEFFAHLTWKTSNFELQGPVRVRSSAAATHFTFITGVYRLQPVQLSTADSTDRDVAMPVGGNQYFKLDLAGGEARDTGPTGESLDPFYASLHLTSSGLSIRLVPNIDIPFDPCLDTGIAGTLPSALPDVVQLVHRQVLGSRLRHQCATPGSQLLTATSTQAAPAHTLLWVLAPIVQDGDRYRMLTSMVLVRSAALSPSQGTRLQTENLLLLSRDDTDTDDLGTIVGLHNVTAETDEQFLLNQAAIDERLKGVEAAGAVVQRMLRVSRPATLRVIRRTSTPGAPASGSLAALNSSGVAALLDFRIATPREASGLRRHFAARYLLDDPPVDADIDGSATAWRRFGVRDVQRSDRPTRSAAAAEYGFLFSERTAFHHMPQPGALPPPDQVFPASASLATSFRPQTIEIQMAPDKPGAMFHHAIHALESVPDTPAGTSLPRPRTLVSESVADFALREPMQLAPPTGADLAIKVAHRTHVRYRQAEQIHVEWKETLGTIAVKATAIDVPLQQLGDPNSWPRPADVRVGLSDVPFLQLIVRINDDLFEIDARQAQFPLYDARQSAATAGELDDRTKSFRESNNSQDRRPDPPQMDLQANEPPVNNLSVSSSAAGLWGSPSPGPSLPFGDWMSPIHRQRHFLLLLSTTQRMINRRRFSPSLRRTSANRLFCAATTARSSVCS